MIDAWKKEERDICEKMLELMKYLEAEEKIYGEN